MCSTYIRFWVPSRLKFNSLVLLVKTLRELASRTTLINPISVYYYLELRTSIMFESPIELLLVKIELSSNTLLPYITLNSNTYYCNWDIQ